MQPPSVTLQKKRFWIFLAGLSLAVVCLGGIATSRYGAGVASDSVKYMAVAQNLLDGKGLYDHRGSPLLAWPPFYSMLLAGLKLITGQDVFIAGWFLNLFLLGLNLFLSGVIFQRVFSEQPLYAYLSTLFVFLSVSSLRIHVTIGSDALYLTMTLAFLLAVDHYVRQGSWRAFIIMVLLSALAPMQRYVGLAVPVTALIVIFIEQRKSFRVMVRDGFVLGAISILPIFWWLVVHNIMTYGSLWGITEVQVVDVVQNIELALTKMLHWFIPYFSFITPLLLRPFILLGGLVLILALINIRTAENWRNLWRALIVPSTYPMMVYASVYFSALAATVVTSDHRYLPSDRYYVILLVPTIVLVLLGYDHLIRPHLRFSNRQLVYGLGAFFALWSIYPVFGIREYLSNAVQRGEPSDYNLFNTRAYHEMKVVDQMQKLRNDQPDAIVYSNYSDAVWFYTRKPARVLPVRNAPDLTAAYSSWPGANAGYIIWFKPNEYKHYLSPEELSQFAALELVYSDKSGDIYYVHSR